MDATRYIIWDWNGTLLNDVDASLAALNRMLAERHLSATSLTFYRDNFGFPVRPLYSKLGMDPDAEWERICVDFHRYLAEGPQDLRSDTRAALQLVQDQGVHQSILSALRQDLLLRDTTAMGVAPFFDTIFGVDNLNGATKLSRGREFLEQLKTRQPEVTHLFFIGDTLHDAEVGHALGAQPILVEGGHQSATRLRTAGCPVVSSLLAAVQLALTTDLHAPASDAR